MKVYIKSTTDNIKLTDDEVKQFLLLLDEYGEFVFGEFDEIKEQLESVLNARGYWSGVQYRYYYDDEYGFYAESRW